MKSQDTEDFAAALDAAAEGLAEGVLADLGAARSVACNDTLDASLLRDDTALADPAMKAVIAAEGSDARKLTAFLRRLAPKILVRYLVRTLRSRRHAAA